ncbi:hypothetical protein VSU01S_14820 [Vibrio superstes NBRC 103154]|uniref:Uncharacterized protein n=1 Tax=Vibrio superstes NBRC 103154 TaxID=1219062 RepID=A0A511QQ43_9VIBR|nr:hypothetical protein VSU01S_14820 [Vibrio superstes NBRC 103154]
MTYDSHGGRIAIEHVCNQSSKQDIYDSHGDRIDEVQGCSHQSLNGNNYSFVSPDEERNSHFSWKDPANKTGGDYAWVSPDEARNAHFA